MYKTNEEGCKGSIRTREEDKHGALYVCVYFCETKKNKASAFFLHLTEHSVQPLQMKPNDPFASARLKMNS